MGWIEPSSRGFLPTLHLLFPLLHRLVMMRARLRVMAKAMVTPLNNDYLNLTFLLSAVSSLQFPLLL